ncbi:MAG TPA: hypothetical protein VMX38_05335 [Verrucomicrobiae bacterium]|jgi:hypothetical protein|nr:hypothetical protein [Verrucomicrobiae bacterium]
MNLPTRTARKAVLVTLCVLVVLWVLGCVAIYHAMRQPPEAFGHVMARIPGPVAFLVFPFETMWMRARRGTLQIGDSAPDFKLTKLDHSGDVQLSSFAAQGRPLVLIFGSYT